MTSVKNIAQNQIKIKQNRLYILLELFLKEMLWMLDPTKAQFILLWINSHKF